MTHALYLHMIEDDVHVLIDQDLGGKSLTNDVEFVIQNLARAGNDLSLPVIYCDATGRYDRILVRNGKFAGFGYLHTKDRATAIRLVKRSAK